MLTIPSCYVYSEERAWLEQMNYTAKMRVRGEFALFTRPEFKSERVSYEVITPPAAKGVFESIYWKPEIRWEIVEIAILKYPQRMSLLRNEIKSRQKHIVAQRWAESGDRFEIESDRTQRHSLILKDVDYVLTAKMYQMRADSPLAKHIDIFERRLNRGQCFQQPYFGLREFVAEFEPATGEEKPIDWTSDLGYMPLTLGFETADDGKFTFKRHEGNGEWVKGQIRPQFFRAHVESGILKIPEVQNVA